MCVCVSVCVYVCVYLLQQSLPFHGHMCLDVELCVCVYVCVCVYIFISMCECAWVRVCVPLAAEPALPSTRVLGCGAVCGSWSHQDDSAVDSEHKQILLLTSTFICSLMYLLMFGIVVYHSVPWTYLTWALRCLLVTTCLVNISVGADVWHCGLSQCSCALSDMSTEVSVSYNMLGKH